MSRIYQDAIDCFGPEHQMRIAQEECAELIQSINWYLREKIPVDKLIEEMVDVSIMIEQLKIILDVPEGTVAYFRALKVDRLRETIKKIEGEAEHG